MATLRACLASLLVSLKGFLGAVWGLFYELFCGHLICHTWPWELRVLLLDFVITCVIVAFDKMLIYVF